MLWMEGLGTGRLLVMLGVSLFDDLCPFCCCRFVTGIEFREGSLLINPKCPLRAQKGMVFNVNVGFAGLSNPSADDQAGRSYVLLGTLCLLERWGRIWGGMHMGGVWERCRWEGWNFGGVWERCMWHCGRCMWEGWDVGGV